MNYVLLTAITLFFIMDPLGNIPVFLSILNRVEPNRRRFVLRREILIALGIFLLFFFFGKPVVTFLGLKQSAIGIGGGVVLFLISIKMIFPEEKKIGEAKPEEPFIVPLAVPLFAGPSVLAMILLIESSNPNAFFQNLLAVILAWFASACILLLSNHINKIIGNRVLVAMERLMGMLLIIISVQMLLDGIMKYMQ